MANSPTTRKPIYASLIDAYAKCGKPEEAHWLYKEVIEKGHDLDAVIISIVLNALTNYGMFSKPIVILCSLLESSLEALDCRHGF